MKKTVIASLVAVMVLSLVAYAGNGAPSGPHFNLNLIGIKEGHEKNMVDCDSGNRIFVQLGNNGRATTRINLTSCEATFGAGCNEFGVLDCDGTDGTASFMLPNPDPGDGSNCTRYSVYVRPLGSPKGNPDFRMTTCAEDELGVKVCSTESVSLTRTKGPMKFQNVSKELLTMCVEVLQPDGSYQLERIYLFDDMFQSYFWEYDNGGVKLLQMRFYLEPSCYSGADWTCH